MTPSMNGRPPTSATEAEVTVRLNERDRGRCAACGLASDAATLAVFHRQSPHSPVGLDRYALAGLLLICGTPTAGCRRRIADEPGWARGAGLTVSGYRDPADVPVEHAVHGRVFLGQDGAVVPVGDRSGE